MRVSAFKAVSGGGKDMSDGVGEVHITGGFGNVMRECRYRS